MKKIIILALFLSFSIQAQFLEKSAPTELELKVNNSNDVRELIQMAGVEKSKAHYPSLVKILKKAVSLKPFIPILQFQLAEAYSLNDDKSEAFNTLIQLQKQGLYFDVENNVNFANIKEYPVFTYIKENLDANKKPYGEGKEVFNLDKSFSGLLFESIAFDTKSESFLFGSLRDGSVLKVASDGAITTLVPATNGGMQGPWAVTDLAVNSANDVLWVASAAVSQFGKVTKESMGMAGIFKYQLSTGKLLTSYLIPENKRPSLISSMHLSKQGNLYFIGALKNVVLQIEKDAKDISIVFTTKEYTNLRSITTDETGKYLYISDNERGILIVDTKNEKVFSIGSTKSLALIGITDLIYDDNGLVFIQSGISPERVMRIVLKEDKVSIKNIIPVESSNALVSSSTYGVIVGDMLYYIANSQAPKTNAYGGLVAGQQWENMAIIATPKHFQEQESLNFKKKIEALKKKTGSN